MSSSSATLDRGDSSPPTKKHKRCSSGDLSVNELDELTVVLKDIVTTIGKARAQWGDLEELDHLTDETDAMIKRVKTFQNLKKKDDNAMIISLSNMDREILSERLGMKETKIIDMGNGSVHLLDKLQTAAIRAQSSGSSSVNFDTIKQYVSQWDQTSLLNTLSILEESVHKQSEAAARMIIDPCLLQAMHLIQSMDETYKPILFPELLIWSRNSETDDPPTIRYNEQVTYLAGSTDYGLLNLLPSTGVVTANTRIRNMMLAQDNAVRTLHFFNPNDVLNVYEAKRLSKSLEGHEPQVIAQCLA
ncbi:hypothetical protein C0995_001026, partial [Termitomyces sp. Mi166